jgi:hypothetical protein
MFGMQTASDVRKLMVQQIRRKGPTLLKWLQTWTTAESISGRLLAHPVVARAVDEARSVLPTATEVETEWHQPGPNHGLADRCFAPVLVVPGRRAQSEIGHLAPLLVAPLTGNVTRGCKAPASAAPSPLVPAGC